MKEIERKILIKNIPNLNNIIPIRYERYFLSNDDKEQIRVQKRGNQYELEKKMKINDIEFQKEKYNITESEFMELSKKSNKVIVRDGYLISEKPNITIKKYYGDYDGLVRVEIEFESIEDSNDFIVPDWIGKEITGTELANDNKLILLNRQQFFKILGRLYE